VLATWYVISSPNHDIFWRAYSPAKALSSRVAEIPVEDALQILTQPNTSGSLPWSMKIKHMDGRGSTIRSELGWKRFNKEKRFLRSLTADFPLHEGTAVFVRPSAPAAVLAASMRNQGIRTVAESDDNYFARDKNLALRMELDEQDLDIHARSMASFDACVFSTRDLRDRYAQEFKERFDRIPPEMHVAENAIDEHDWPDRIERTGPLRVGFMGSSSHVWDINVLYGSFQVAKELGAETHMIGYNPGSQPEGEITATAQANVDAWAAVVDKHTPWIDSIEFRKHGLPLDIALCPLRHDDFTIGKSDVKAIEATISGAAVVAANIPVFNRHWKHEETCLLANSHQEFAQATARLVRDAKLRYELVTAAQEYVLAERGRKLQRRQWKEAVIG
jgi:glycosyltransferase involved in cell wall biosynthesis